MKSREVKSMTKEERLKKLEELKVEMMKARAGASKTGTSKNKMIRKIIARIHTHNAQEEKAKAKTKSGGKK